MTSTVTHTKARKPGSGLNLSGRTIYLDPGHAGIVPADVPSVTDGRGGVKPCQVTGTAALDGLTEAQFNWDMATTLSATLENTGASTLMTRSDNSSVADCIDERARKENASNADLVISIHADGAPSGSRGFHIIVVGDPLPENKKAESVALAGNIRDALIDAGFTTSNYLGTDGIDYRNDLTGLNLSSKPKVLIEFGNMQDPQDYAILSSHDSRQRMAEAITRAVHRTLGA